MHPMISLKNVSKTYGDDTLFHDLSIDFKPGEQLGLIGMNGSGKSSLLKLISREIEPDTGELIHLRNQRIIYLPQEDRFERDQTIEQVLYQTARDYIPDEQEQHRVVQKAMGKALFEKPDTRVDMLSGGWKKKLAITRALCSKPDFLLLDEPTNHLDISGILWLENILKSSGFSFVVVSHDRSFLEQVCSHIIEIGKHYPQGFFKIKGDYPYFLQQRTKFLTAQEKMQASLTSKMRREDEWLRQGPKARTSKAKYRIEQAHDLRQQLSAIKNRNKNAEIMNIDFESTGRKTKKLLRAFHITRSIEKQFLFKDLSFELGPGFCLGVSGENGSGKSTFLSILEKRIKPDQGKIEWAQDLKIAVYDQNRSALNPAITLKEALNPSGTDSVNFQGRSLHVVSWAKRFLFLPDQLQMPVEKLSGGEKARILIANLMLTPCDILFLDEPTNDLDILSLEVLEDSIRQFPGAVVIVSHDRYLMNKVCHRILYLDRQSGGQFFKNFDQIIEFRKKTAVQQPVKKKNKPKSLQKPAKKLSYKDQFELEHIEDKILQAEQHVEELSVKVQSPEILKNAEQMKALCQELKTAQSDVQLLYDRWEQLESLKIEVEGSDNT